jgi:peptidoglycan/LPS O-acetylase OafA/YrhL
MSTFLSILAPIIYGVAVGIIFLLVVLYISKKAHYMPSLKALGILLAVGISLFSIVNVILSKYSPSKWFTYICLAILALPFCFMAYRIAKRLQQEKKVPHEED